MKKSEAIKLRALIEQSVQSLPDAKAVKGIVLHPRWQSNGNYPVGCKVQHGGKLWRCLQAHSPQEGWEPESTPSLWEHIDEVHSGDRYDPIPYEGSMALSEGLYYSQDSAVYLCIRDTVNPVYSPLRDLVGLYVKEG